MPKFQLEGIQSQTFKERGKRKWKVNDKDWSVKHRENRVHNNERIPTKEVEEIGLLMTSEKIDHEENEKKALNANPLFFKENEKTISPNSTQGIEEVRNGLVSSANRFIINRTMDSEYMTENEKMSGNISLSVNLSLQLLLNKKKIKVIAGGYLQQWQRVIARKHSEKCFDQVLSNGKKSSAEVERKGGEEKEQQLEEERLPLVMIVEKIQRELHACYLLGKVTNSFVLPLEHDQIYAMVKEIRKKDSEDAIYPGDTLEIHRPWIRLDHSANSLGVIIADHYEITKRGSSPINDSNNPYCLNSRERMVVIYDIPNERVVNCYQSLFSLDLEGICVSKLDEGTRIRLLIITHHKLPIIVYSSDLSWSTCFQGNLYHLTDIFIVEKQFISYDHDLYPIIISNTYLHHASISTSPVYIAYTSNTSRLTKLSLDH